MARGQPCRRDTGRPSQGKDQRRKQGRNRLEPTLVEACAQRNQQQQPSNRVRVRQYGVATEAPSVHREARAGQRSKKSYLELGVCKQTSAVTSAAHAHAPCVRRGLMSNGSRVHYPESAG